MEKDLRKIFGDHPNLDAKSIDWLTKALEKNNLPGFDYLEYKQSLGALKSMNLDDATSFKSAFATASVVGLTKKTLLESAQHYIRVLSKEKQQFDEALGKQMELRVKQKQTEVDKLKTGIEQYRAQITELQNKITQSQQIIDQADEAIQTQRRKIEKTRDNFEEALKSILDQINFDIDRIGQYLP